VGKSANGLRRELSFVEAIALSIGIMAPTAAMALNGSLAAGIAGSGVPLAFLLATIAVALASFSFIQFSRYFAHSGSIYAFNGIALGPRVGFFSGWALLGTYVAFTCASVAEVGNFAEAFFAGLQVSVDWLPLALIAGTLIWVFAYGAITLSTRLTLVIEGISVLLIALLALVILVKFGAAGQLTVQPFNPGNQPLHTVGLAASLAFSRSPVLRELPPLARRHATHAAIFPWRFWSLWLTPASFMSLSPMHKPLALVQTAGIRAFASSTSPLGTLGQRYIGSLMATLMNFGATISAFASALGTASASARMLFSLGRDGFITQRLGMTSRRTGSPANAVAIVMLLTFAVVLTWSRAPGVNGASLFGFLGTIGVFLILVAYILTNVAALRFFVARRLWSWQWIVPVLAIVVPGYTLYSNLYPIPNPPYNIFPYVALAWLVVGLVIILTSPTLVRQIGLRLAESEGLHTEERAGPAS
jgi:amino acid transporter